jgi:hypothetical protein
MAARKTRNGTIFFKLSPFIEKHHNITSSKRACFFDLFDNRGDLQATTNQSIIEWKVRPNPSCSPLLTGSGSVPDLGGAGRLYKKEKFPLFEKGRGEIFATNVFSTMDSLVGLCLLGGEDR